MMLIIYIFQILNISDDQHFSFLQNWILFNILQFVDYKYIEFYPVYGHIDAVFG